MKTKALRIGVVGSGLIGRAWAIVFARGGCSVKMFDPMGGIAEQALASISDTLEGMAKLDLLQGQSVAHVASRITATQSLADAVGDADYVQENSPERVEVKRQVFEELEAATSPTTVIGSSTSAIVPSQFTGHIEHKQRCLVVHPLNPPHLIPAVEVVPAPWTSQATIDFAAELMRTIGQKPIVMTREIEGFLMNRLQGAVLEECFRLVSMGLVEPADIDTSIRDGLALRWSFMGPFETSDLNAPGGIVDYAARYEPGFIKQFESQTTRVGWSGETLDKINTYRRKHVPLGEIAARQSWRDRRLMALAAHKRQAARDHGE
jgi:L-gulonate 3-dehydrogenase